MAHADHHINGAPVDADRIRGALTFIRSDERDTWLRMCMAIKAELGEDGRDLFHEWSATADNYSERDADAVWRSVKRSGGVTVATLLHEARQSGWRDDGARVLISRKQIAERDWISRERAERERAETAKKAAAIVGAASVVHADHPYAVKKGIAVDGLQEVQADALSAFLDYKPKSGGVELTGRLLVAPITVDGKLSSVEMIDETGRKAALAGRGTRSGGYWATGTISSDYAGPLLLAEGVATAISASTASGHPCLACFSNTNILAVAQAMTRMFPKASLIVLADLQKDGLPDRHASAAATAVNAALAVPTFGADRPEWATDINDMLQLHGAEAVADVIRSAVAPRSVEADPTTSKPRSNAPDMSIIRHNSASAPALDLSLFGDALGAWIANVARSKSCPLDYVAFALLGGVAGVIGASRWVTPWEGWREPVIIWTMLVGNPSAGKSPAMDAVSSPIVDVEREEGADWPETKRAHESLAVVAKARREAWESEVKTAIREGKSEPSRPHDADDPPPPQMPRIMVTDVTIEKCTLIEAGNPRGILLWRDESAGWLANLGKYGEGDRGYWLEAYGGRPYNVDRVKHAEPIRLEHHAASIVGGIQPDRMASLLMSGDDDGMFARFLYVWPDVVRPRRPVTRPDVTVISRVMQRLRTLDFRPNQNGELRPVTLPIDAAALDAFGEWRELHHDASQAMTGLAASAYGKMPGAALRLALVLELLWWASGPADAAEPTSVSGDALGAAIDLIEGYVKPMLVRVLGEASLPTVDRHTAALGREIIKRRVTVINARDVRREWRLPGMREASAVSAAISALVEAGWLVPIPTRDGGTAGRQRQDYAVDPRVHGGAS